MVRSATSWHLECEEPLFDASRTNKTRATPHSVTCELSATRGVHLDELCSMKVSVGSQKLFQCCQARQQIKYMTMHHTAEEETMLRNPRIILIKHANTKNTCWNPPQCRQWTKRMNSTQRTSRKATSCPLHVPNTIARFFCASTTHSVWSVRFSSSTATSAACLCWASAFSARHTSIFCVLLFLSPFVFHSLLLNGLRITLLCQFGQVMPLQARSSQASDASHR